MNKEYKICLFIVHKFYGYDLCFNPFFGRLKKNYYTKARKCKKKKNSIAVDKNIYLPHHYYTLGIYIYVYKESTKLTS